MKAKVSNIKRFPSLAFEEGARQITVQCSSLTWPNPAGGATQQTPVFIPLFAPGMMQSLYRDLFAQLSLVSTGSLASFGLAGITYPPTENIYPSRDVDFLFRDSLAGEILQGRMSCTQMPYADLQEYLKTDCLKCTGIRFSYTARRGGGEDSVLGLQRSNPIYFFTNNIFGSFDLNPVSILSVLDPRNSYASKDEGTEAATGKLQQRDVLDFPVDFILSKSSGIAIPVQSIMGVNSQIEDFQLTITVQKGRDNCQKINQTII